jgi:protein-L-isoaspartate O-methyltransferase
MRARRRGGMAMLALALVLAPRAALACAACLSSAYGDRSFNWAYGALMLAPFLVAVVIGAVLAWNAGYRLRWRASLRASTVSGHIPANEERS